MFAGARAIATALAIAAVVRSDARTSARERHSGELSPVQPGFPKRVYRR
jgi:hypothetical protein